MFINLSRIVINKSHISAISKGHGKYIIHLVSSIDGSIIAGSCGIKAECDAIEILHCEKKNIVDYKILTNWVNIL
jgi:hypothetical protein